MGRRLLVTYNTPPYAYYPPSYPFKQGTKTFCEQFVKGAMKLKGFPDWQSRAGSILAGEVCGRGFEAIFGPSEPEVRGGRKRQTWIGKDGTLYDYPVPKPQPKFPGPRQGQPNVPRGTQPVLPLIPQSIFRGPRQPYVPLLPQMSLGSPGQPQVPGLPQPPLAPNGQQPNLPGPRQTPLEPVSQLRPGQTPQGVYVFGQQQPSGVPYQPSSPQSPQSPSTPATPQSPSGPSGQPPSMPGPRQPGGNPGGSQPPGVGFIPDIPSRPRIKPGGTDLVPDSGSPVTIGPGPDGGISIGPDLLYITNWIASFFGQTAIKAQKVGIQDFFTPIFKQYARTTGLPLRDGHFLQFDPKGVDKYALSDPAYASLIVKLSGNEDVISNYFSGNPGPGLTQRIVNQFVTNAAINGWSPQQAETLWNGVIAGIQKKGG